MKWPRELAFWSKGHLPKSRTLTTGKTKKGTKDPSSGGVCWLSLATGELDKLLTAGFIQHLQVSSHFANCHPMTSLVPLFGEVDRLELANIQEQAAPDLGTTCLESDWSLSVSALQLQPQAMNTEEGPILPWGQTKPFLVL